MMDSTILLVVSSCFILLPRIFPQIRNLQDFEGPYVSFNPDASLSLDALMMGGALSLDSSKFD